MASTYGGSLASSAAVGGDGGDTTYHLATTSSNSTTETAQAMTNALKFATSKSIRTSTIILASFNAMAALATASGIIYHCYTYSKRNQRRPYNASALQHEMKPLPIIPTPDRPSGLFFIHTVEVFPLVLALGIAIQSVIFAAAQSIGLQALLSRGCTAAAVFMLPALFIAPYIQLVFGLETAVRGLRSQFSARRQRNVAICLCIVASLLLVTLFVAVGDQAPDYCFASLFWIIEHFAVGAFVLFLLISIALIIAIATILVKLSRSHAIERTERLAASRMIYYLALGFISNAFIIPFFFSLTFLDQKKYIFETLNLSMVASVVSNLNGLMVSCLHMFLRSQTNSAIGHNYGGDDRDRSKRDSGDEYRKSAHTTRPVTDATNDNRATSGSVATLQQAVDAEEGRMGESPTSPSPLDPDTRPPIIVPETPTFPAPTRPPSAAYPSESRKQSYSLFPLSPSAAGATLPATEYSSTTTKPNRDSYKPPPIVKPWLGRGHRRQSSIESSATVQIGIRLSNMDVFRPSKTSMDTQRLDTVVRPSPLAQIEKRNASESAAPERSSTRDALMKTLPPVPTTCVEDNETTAAESEGNNGNKRNSKRRDPTQPTTLGSSVYNPDDSSIRRTASNRSVNRNARVPTLAGVRLSMMANRANGDRGSKHAPPRPRGSTMATQAPMTKADWI